MIEDYYLHLYTEWKSKKENKEGSWKESKGRKFYLCLGVFILSCMFFIVMSIKIILTINNVSHTTPIVFFASIVVFMIMTIITGSVSKQRISKNSTDDFNNYLEYCIKLHNHLVSSINRIQLYNRITNNIRKTREELETNSKKPFRIASYLLVSVYIVFCIYAVQSIIDSYLGDSFSKDKAISISTGVIAILIFLALIWAGTYLYSKFDNKLIKTYKEMERDFQTIIDLNDNLFAKYKNSIHFSYDKPQL